MSYLYTNSCLCFVNIQAVRSSRTCTREAEESSSGLTLLQQISSKVSELKELCQLLITRQAAFEQQLSARLDHMQGYLDELLVLAPTPIQSMQSSQVEFVPSTPNDHPAMDLNSFSHPTVPSTLPSQLTEAPVPETILSMGDPSTCEADLHRHPSSLSLIRANSCSRENFASKLVKRMFSIEERSTSNVKGVLGKKKFNEPKMAYIQKLTFENFPCASAEQKKCWAKCVRAIDSANRTLCRSIKTANKENETPV